MPVVAHQDRGQSSVPRLEQLNGEDAIPEPVRRPESEDELLVGGLGSQ